MCKPLINHSCAAVLASQAQTRVGVGMPSIPFLAEAGDAVPSELQGGELALMIRQHLDSPSAPPPPAPLMWNHASDWLHPKYGLDFPFYLVKHVCRNNPKELEELRTWITEFPDYLYVLNGVAVVAVPFPHIRKKCLEACFP